MPDGQASVSTRRFASLRAPSMARAVRLLKRIPLHLVVIAIVLLWSIPTLALAVSSFREATAITTSGWWTTVKAPFDFTLDNYKRVLEQRGMGQAFLNSLIITVPSTVIVILVASFAAYAFAWMRFPARNGLFLTVLGGRLFGVGSFSAMWLAHTAYGLPFAVYLLRNFFGGLPRDLAEAAYLDGASDLQVLFRIVLPLAKPAIAALAIFQFLWVWNDLLVALVFLGDPRLAPMTLRITNLVSSFGASYQLLTAAAFVSMALPLVLFLALQRYFVEGMLAGAIKG